ncbi:MAG: hypothetical protein M5U28_42900 [Sandaracinaceae bacterium]|nr:hypothetical protein [Sandaracinaceae bacterium]
MRSPLASAGAIPMTELARGPRVSQRCASCTVWKARTGARLESAVMFTRATAISEGRMNATRVKPRSAADSQSHMPLRTSAGGSPTSPRASMMALSTPLLATISSMAAVYALSSRRFRS